MFFLGVWNGDPTCLEASTSQLDECTCEVNTEIFANPEGAYGKHPISLCESQGLDFGGWVTTALLLVVA